MESFTEEKELILFILKKNRNKIGNKNFKNGKKAVAELYDSYLLEYETTGRELNKPYFEIYSYLNYVLGQERLYKTIDSFYALKKSKKEKFVFTDLNIIILDT